MKEQSHKAEMASALQGDFARLRARGVATTLPAVPPERCPQVAEPDDVPAIAAEAHVADGVQPEQGSDLRSSPAPWLQRLLGR